MSIYESICGLNANKTYQFDKTIRIGSEGGSEGGRSVRYTVGDFDFLPSAMPVDERRCKTDSNYSKAMAYIADVSSLDISRKAFNKDKKYRDALNLLVAGTKAKSLEDRIKKNFRSETSSSEEVQVRGARISAIH